MGSCDMKMSEKINFQYESYQSIIAKNFKKIINEDEFYDVTLVSDDQIHFSAHKLVLSSTSSYFKNILKKTKHSHPLLCLDGIESSDLKYVLQYIYNGEVNVDQEHIDRFLEIALKLQLEGLAKKNRSELEYQNFRNKIQDVVAPSNKTGKYESFINVENQPIIKAEKIDSENFKIENPRSIPEKIENNDEEEPQNSRDIPLTSNEMEVKIEESYEKKEDLYYCKFCDYSSDHRGHIREHIDIHFNFSYDCNRCDKILKTKAALRHHESYHRKQDQTSKLKYCSRIIPEDHTSENLNISEIDAKILDYIEPVRGGYKSKVCQYFSSSKDHVREHLDKHIKFNYNCNQCTKVCASKSSYRKHRSLHKKYLNL